MRNRKDLRMVRFELIGGIQLDMERVEQDPAWAMAGRNYNLDHPEQFDQAVVEYLLHYLGGELLLAEMPTTTGPAELYGMNAEGPNAVAAKSEAARAAALSELNREPCTATAQSAHDTPVGG